MAATVKSVSFQPEVLNYALEVSKELFGDNLSIFITFLICSYRKNQPEFDLKKDEELGEELQKMLKGIKKNFKY
ncbi:hypothetical protein [Clostridium magnum]|uniref:hypothetical protein n=1 Tax=Clostridium magnum TaxID=33954 RepID=UPI000917AEB1|nr:hypothetical protein [Clostridium magnum]SHJ13553.1 hypothetical protein SAMN02745944_05418 [Clostridium magnum DSM 2767]